MDPTQILSALQGKRSELTDALERLERQVDQQRADLGYIDATIRLFDPNIETAVEIVHPSTRPRARNDWFRPGECRRRIDGAYIGGYVRPENLATDRKDRRLAENQSGKRKVVVVMRERDGRARCGGCYIMPGHSSRRVRRRELHSPSPTNPRTPSSSR